MESELKKLTEPIIKGFIDKLLAIENQRTELNNDLAREIEQLRQQQQDLRIQKDDNDKTLRVAKENLEAIKLAHTNLNEQLKDEINKYSEAKREFESKTKALEQGLKDVAIEKQIVAELSAKNKEKALAFEAKDKALDNDRVNLDERKADLDKREKTILSQEKEANKKETELFNKAHELNDLSLKLKAREAEVNRLIKRYELDKSIKGE